VPVAPAAPAQQEPGGQHRDEGDRQEDQGQQRGLACGPAVCR
jgi:hypothetical protein